jgi:hypothetical protein
LIRNAWLLLALPFLAVQTLFGSDLPKTESTDSSETISPVAITNVRISDQQSTEPDWQPWEFLRGKWIGEGAAEVGQGSGYFTFQPDLQNKAWIRRNHSEYPATKERPKYLHDDVMIVYFDPSLQQTRAFYYDSEQHVIQYTVSFPGDHKILTFLSDKQEGAPRFRLTYIRTGAEQMSLTLEMSDPTKPDEFRKIVDGKVQKVVSAE